MAMEPVPPSDPAWAAYNAPFEVHEAESHPGTWIIRNKDGVPLMHGGNRAVAEMMKGIWEEEAAAYWMMAP
jgi:hypothetical protein